MMIGRLVEIADDHRHLFAHRGFMVVKATGESQDELGRIPLDDILAVIAHANGLSYTNNLLVALAERGAPFVLCSANHLPVGMLLPLEGNFEQSKRIEAQIEASLPLRKRLWASIVKAKLSHQAHTLAAISQPSAPLQALVAKVRSGDPENIEAQGARRYWPLLLGSAFRRDQSASGVNALLNYGYTVLRAATARAVIAAGLHPSIGLHHSNDHNAMRLVDDLMEPARPWVDFQVWGLLQRGAVEVTPDVKKSLAQVLYEDRQTSQGTTPVTVYLQRLAISLAQVFLGQREGLELQVSPPLPLQVQLQRSSH